MLSVAALLTIASCKKENGGGVSLSIEKIKVDYNSIQFKMTPQNAEKVAYTVVAKGESIPDAATIISEGKPALAEPMSYVEKGLQRESAYVLAAVAKGSGDTYSPVQTLDFETTERTGFYIDVQVDNLTATSADITIKPSNETDTYYWLCYPRNMYDEDWNAIEIANRFIQLSANYLNGGIGLYKGTNVYKNYELAHGTDYFILVFGYTPNGAAKPSTTPEMIEFRTPDAETSIESLTFEMEITETVAHYATIKITPSDPAHFYYVHVDTPDNFNLEQAKADFEKAMRDRVDGERKQDIPSSETEYVTVNCARGIYEAEAGNLTPETEYKMGVFGVGLDGKPVAAEKVISFTTEKYIVSDATLTADFLGMFKGDDIIEFWPDFTPLAGKPGAIYRPVPNDKAVKCYYMTWNGEATEEYQPDHYLVRYGSFNMKTKEEIMDDIIFTYIPFPDPSLSYTGTILCYAEDADGVAGPIFRLPKEFGYEFCGTKDELKELYDQIKSEQTTRCNITVPFTAGHRNEMISLKLNAVE